MTARDNSQNSTSSISFNEKRTANGPILSDLNTSKLHTVYLNFIALLNNRKVVLTIGENDTCA
jgi:hypothetical protein